eukprot:938328_1
MALQFQSINDYFTQFQNGLHKVNLQDVLYSFERTRDQVIDLLTLESNKHAEIPKLISDMMSDDGRTRASRISRHRMRARDVHDTPRVKVQDIETTTIGISPKAKNQFWSTDWFQWNTKPLQLIGISPKENRAALGTLLWRICMEMDKFYKVLSGYDAKESVIPSLKHGRRKQMRRGQETFFHNFFKDSVTNSMDMEDSKKLIAGLRHAFLFDITKFVLGCAKKRKKRRIRFASSFTGRNKLWRLEMKFDAELFGDAMDCKETMWTMNQYIMFMLREQKDEVNVITFDDIQCNGVALQLLNVVLQFAMVGGRCGRRYDEKAGEYQASIVCELSLLNVNEEGDNIKHAHHFKIPHGVMGKTNMTDGYWTRVTQMFNESEINEAHQTSHHVTTEELQ